MSKQPHRGGNKEGRSVHVKVLTYRLPDERFSTWRRAQSRHGFQRIILSAVHPSEMVI